MRRLPPIPPGPLLDPGEQDVHGPLARLEPLPGRFPQSQPQKAQSARSLGVGLGLGLARGSAFLDAAAAVGLHPSQSDVLGVPNSPVTSGHGSGPNVQPGGTPRAARATLSIGPAYLRPCHSLGHNGGPAAAPDSPLRGAASESAFPPSNTGSLAGSIAAAVPPLGLSRMGPTRTNRASDPGGSGGGGDGGHSVSGGVHRVAAGQRGLPPGVARLQQRVSGQGYGNSAGGPGGSPNPSSLPVPSHLLTALGPGGGGVGGMSMASSLASGSVRAAAGGAAAAASAVTTASPPVSGSVARVQQAEEVLVGTTSLGGAELRGPAAHGSGGGGGRGLWACFCWRPRAAADCADGPSVQESSFSKLAKESKLRRILFPRRLSHALSDTLMVRSGRLTGLAPTGNTSGGNRSMRKQPALSQQPQKSILKSTSGRHATPPREPIHVSVVPASEQPSAPAAAAAAATAAQRDEAANASPSSRQPYTHAASGGVAERASGLSATAQGSATAYDEPSLYAMGMASTTAATPPTPAAAAGGGAGGAANEAAVADALPALGSPVAPSAFAGFAPDGPESQPRSRPRSGTLSASQYGYAQSPQARISQGLHRIITRTAEAGSGTGSPGWFAETPAHGSRIGSASHQAAPGMVSKTSSLRHSISRQAASLTNTVEASSGCGADGGGRTLVLSVSGAPPPGGGASCGGADGGRPSLVHRLTRPRSQRHSSVNGGGGGGGGQAAGHAAAATPAPLVRGASRNAIRPLPQQPFHAEAGPHGALPGGWDPALHQQPQQPFQATLMSLRSFGAAAAAAAAAVTAVSSRPGSPRALASQQRRGTASAYHAASGSHERRSLWAGRRAGGEEGAELEADVAGDPWPSSYGAVSINPLYGARNTAPPGQLAPIAAAAAAAAVASAAAGSGGSGPAQGYPFRSVSLRQTTGGLGLGHGYSDAAAARRTLAPLFQHHSNSLDAGWRQHSGFHRGNDFGAADGDAVPGGDDGRLTTRISAAMPALPVLPEFTQASSHGGPASFVDSGAGLCAPPRRRGRGGDGVQREEEEAMLATTARRSGGGAEGEMAIAGAERGKKGDASSNECIVFSSELHPVAELEGSDRGSEPGELPPQGLFTSRNPSAHGRIAAAALPARAQPPGSAGSSRVNPYVAIVGGDRSATASGGLPPSQPRGGGSGSVGICTWGAAEGSDIAADRDNGHSPAPRGAPSGSQPATEAVKPFTHSPEKPNRSPRAGSANSQVPGGGGNGAAAEDDAAGGLGRSASGSGAHQWVWVAGRLSRAPPPRQALQHRLSLDSDHRHCTTSQAHCSARPSVDGANPASRSRTGEGAYASSLEGCPPSTAATHTGSLAGGVGDSGRGSGSTYAHVHAPSREGKGASVAAAVGPRDVDRRRLRGHSAGSDGSGSSDGPWQHHLDSRQARRMLAEELLRVRSHGIEPGVALETLQAEAAEAAARQERTLSSTQEWAAEQDPDGGEAPGQGGRGLAAGATPGGRAPQPLAPLPPIPQAAASSLPSLAKASMPPLRQRRSAPRMPSKLGMVSGEGGSQHGPSRFSQAAGSGAVTSTHSGSTQLPGEPIADPAGQPLPTTVWSQHQPSRHRLAASASGEAPPPGTVPLPTTPLGDAASVPPPPLPPTTSYPMPKSLSMEAVVTGRDHLSGPVPAAPAAHAPAPIFRRPSPAVGLPLTAAMLRASAEAMLAVSGGAAAASGSASTPVPLAHHDSLARWVRDHSRHAAAAEHPLAPIDPLDELSASIAVTEHSNRVSSAGTPAGVSGLTAAGSTPPTAASPAGRVPPGDDPRPVAMPFYRTSAHRGARLTPEPEVLQQWLHRNTGARPSQDGEGAGSPQHPLPADVRPGSGQ